MMDATNASRIFLIELGSNVSTKEKTSGKTSHEMEASSPSMTHPIDLDPWSHTRLNTIHPYNIAGHIRKKGFLLMFSNFLCQLLLKNARIEKRTML
jgi:hypothetical protein